MQSQAEPTNAEIFSVLASRCLIAQFSSQPLVDQTNKVITSRFADLLRYAQVIELVARTQVWCYLIGTLRQITRYYFVNLVTLLKGPSSQLSYNLTFKQLSAAFQNIFTLQKSEIR